MDISLVSNKLFFGLDCVVHNSLTSTPLKGRASAPMTESRHALLHEEGWRPIARSCGHSLKSLSCQLGRKAKQIFWGLHCLLLGFYFFALFFLCIVSNTHLASHLESLCLLVESMKLWQSNLLACRISSSGSIVEPSAHTSPYLGRIHNRLSVSHKNVRFTSSLEMVMSALWSVQRDVRTPKCEFPGTMVHESSDEQIQWN